MRKIDKFIDELQALKAKGYDAKKINALTEGVNLIAAEYRKRKAKEEAQHKAMVEAAGFAKLDEQCKASGLSKKSFVEGVGKTIIESNQPEDIKTRLMETLDKYVNHLMEAQDVSGCIFSLKPVDDKAKAFLAKNDVTGLLHDWVLPQDAHKYGYAATAVRERIDTVSKGEGLPIGQRFYYPTRKLIDRSHEKLFVLTPENRAQNSPSAFILHYADTPKTVNPEQFKSQIKSSGTKDSPTNIVANK